MSRLGLNFSSIKDMEDSPWLQTFEENEADNTVTFFFEKGSNKESVTITYIEWQDYKKTKGYLHG